MELDMNINSGTLQTVDVNVLPYSLKSLHLPKPPQRRVSASQLEQRQQQQQQHAGVVITAPLRYVELQRHLRDTLLRLELMQSCTCSVEDRRQQLRSEVSRLLAATDDETRAQLTPLFRSWSNPSDVPLSYQVLEVLKLRRRELCRGFELGLCELKEWLLLARCLGEPGLAELVAQYAQDLGPFSRQRVEDTLRLHRTADTATLCQALLEIPAPSVATTPFDARYCNLIVEDLIAMADAAPAPNAIAAVQGDAAAQLREPLTEWMLQLCIAGAAQLETYFLAVAILDRVFARVAVGRERLHLFGCAALLLASKQEEIYSIPLRTLVRYGGDRFTVDELVATECQIFALLGFDTVCATLSAVGMALMVSQEPVGCERQRFFLLYALATMAVRTHSRQFRISAVAAACVYLSRACFHIPTGAPSEEVRELLPVVAAAVNRNAAGSGLHEVFSRPAFGEVAKIRLPGNP